MIRLYCWTMAGEMVSIWWEITNPTHNAFLWGNRGVKYVQSTVRRMQSMFWIWFDVNCKEEITRDDHKWYLGILHRYKFCGETVTSVSMRQITYHLGKYRRCSSEYGSSGIVLRCTIRCGEQTPTFEPYWKVKSTFEQEQWVDMSKGSYPSVSSREHD